MEDHKLFPGLGEDYKYTVILGPTIQQPCMLIRHGSTIEVYSRKLNWAGGVRQWISMDDMADVVSESFYNYPLAISWLKDHNIEWGLIKADALMDFVQNYEQTHTND